MLAIQQQLPEKVLKYVVIQKKKYKRKEKGSWAERCINFVSGFKDSSSYIEDLLMNRDKEVRVNGLMTQIKENKYRVILPNDESSFSVFEI